MKIILSVIIFLFTIQVTAGDPWPVGKGKSFSQVSFSYLPYQFYFNSESSISEYINNKQNSVSSVQIYSEFGLTSHINFSVSLPFSKVSTASDIEKSSNFGIGNSQIRLTYAKEIKRIQVSGGIGIELPSTSNEDSPRQLRVGREVLAIIPNFSIGKGYSKLYWSIKSSAYLRPSSEYSNTYGINAELGYQIHSRAWLIIVSHNMFSDFSGELNSTLAESSLQDVFFIDNQEFQAIGLKGSYEIGNGIGFSGGVYGAFGGRNVAASPSFNVGVYFKR